VRRRVPEVFNLALFSVCGGVVEASAMYARSIAQLAAAERTDRNAVRGGELGATAVRAASFLPAAAAMRGAVLPYFVTLALSVRVMAAAVVWAGSIGRLAAAVSTGLIVVRGDVVGAGDVRGESLVPAAAGTCGAAMPEVASLALSSVRSGLVQAAAMYAGSVGRLPAAVSTGWIVVRGDVVGEGDVRAESLVPAAAGTCRAAMPEVASLALFSVRGGLVQAAAMNAGSIGRLVAAVNTGLIVVRGDVVGAGDVRGESLVPAAAGTCRAAMPEVASLALFSVRGGLVQAAVVWAGSIGRLAAAVSTGLIVVRGDVVGAGDVRGESLVPAAAGTCGAAMPEVANLALFSVRGSLVDAAAVYARYSRSPKLPTLQLLQKSS